MKSARINYFPIKFREILCKRNGIQYGLTGTNESVKHYGCMTRIYNIETPPTWTTLNWKLTAMCHLISAES